MCCFAYLYFSKFSLVTRFFTSSSLLPVNTFNQHAEKGVSRQDWSTPHLVESSIW